MADFWIFRYVTDYASSCFAKDDRTCSRISDLPVAVSHVILGLH
jgi:hypothetical protein